MSLTHVVISRACGAGGQCAEVKVSFDKQPSPQDTAAVERATVAAYIAAFGREPRRWGTGTLPYCEEHDG